MYNVGKIIKKLRHRKGLTLQQLGDAIGKTAAYLSIIENKRSKLKPPLLKQIADALGAEMSYFVDSEDDDVLKKPILQDLQDLVDRHMSLPERRPLGHRIPVLTETAAGQPLSREDPFPVGVADEYVEVPPEITDPHAFGLRIKGDSMEPRLCEGDVVVICPTWPVHEGKPVVAKVNEDEVTCKLFSKTEDSIVLTPINKNYEPQVYPESKVVWVYPVVRAILKLYGK